LRKLIVPMFVLNADDLATFMHPRILYQLEEVAPLLIFLSF
jgi:hypothetical protein